MGITPAEGTRTGTVILLNGTSSAGKTTLARELQGLLTDSYLHVEADTFSRMMPHGRYDAATFLATRCAMNSFAAVLAASGLNSVVDTLLTTRTWLKDCVDKLADYRVMFVGVLCPPDELERRERARGDRRIGQGLDQLPFVHAHGLYDIEIDTSQASPRTCAERILHRLETVQRQQLFGNFETPRSCTTKRPMDGF